MAWRTERKCQGTYHLHLAIQRSSGLMHPDGFVATAAGFSTKTKNAKNIGLPLAFFQHTVVDNTWVCQGFRCVRKKSEFF